MTSVLTRLPPPILDARSPSRLRWKMGAEGVLYVGQRVSSGGDFGFVRYVGPVPPTKGEWVGVEWDDPTRGKHDGSKDGVVYFECVHNTGGSFVRPHKVSTGISATQALVERYASSGLEDPSLSAELYLENYKTHHRKMVETVGMEKVNKLFKNLKGLKSVGLRMQNISHCGDEDFFLIKSPNIEDMDLSKNLFHEWESVAKISAQLKKLLQLNLSQNLMQVPRSPSDLKSSFSSLNALILNGCRLKWIDVVSCEPMWPQIEELHLDKNQISDITPPSGDQFQKLKLLNFSDNPINDWKNISNLSKLHSLKKLILTRCGLSEAQIREDDFVTLTEITLSSNKFSKEDIFNQLNKLRNLEGLMFSKNPVLSEETAETLREIIIAKIGRLKMLNRTIINTTERQGSEMDYLKKHGRYWRESGGHQDPEKNKPSEGFQKDHPRYLELINIHGARADEEFFIKSNALKSNLLEVTIVVPDKPDVKPLKKKLPNSMTVGALKVLIFRVLKIPIKEQRLEYISHHNSNHVVRMDKDSESMYYISLENGDTVRVLPRYSDAPWTVKFH